MGTRGRTPEGRWVVNENRHIEQCPFEEHEHTIKLNTNSYISLGLMITIIGCALWINNAVKDLGYRIKTLEDATLASPWTSVDMFKWAVKLQKDNPAIKVPEPKHEHGE